MDKLSSEAIQEPLAAVDQGPESVHLQDLLRLSPSQEELARAADWVATQDASEAFDRMLREVVEHVRQRR